MFSKILEKNCISNYIIILQIYIYIYIYIYKIKLEISLMALIDNLTQNLTKKYWRGRWDLENY